MLDKAHVVHRHHYRHANSQWRRVLHMQHVRPGCFQYATKISAQSRERIRRDLVHREPPRNPFTGSGFGYAGNEIGRRVQLGKFPQQTTYINFVSRKAATDCMSIYGKTHSIHSVYRLSTSKSCTSKAVPRFFQTTSQLYWYSNVPRPLMPIRCISPSESRRFVTHVEKFTGFSAMRQFC